MVVVVVVAAEAVVVALSSNFIPKGADWAGGLPGGGGASAAPVPLAAAVGGGWLRPCNLPVEWPTEDLLVVFLDLGSD